MIVYVIVVVVLYNFGCCSIKSIIVVAKTIVEVVLVALANSNGSSSC